MVVEKVIQIMAPTRPMWAAFATEDPTDEEKASGEPEIWTCRVEAWVLRRVTYTEDEGYPPESNVVGLVMENYGGPELSLVTECEAMFLGYFPHEDPTIEERVELNKHVLSLRRILKRREENRRQEAK